MSSQAPDDPEQARGANSSITALATRLFLVWAALLTYQFVFQLTKPSPLSDAPAGAVVATGALVVACASALAIVCAFLARALQLSVTRSLKPSVVPTVAVALVAALLTLSFVENMLYTAAGLGLKTDDSLILRFAMLTVAVAVGSLVARVVREPKDRTKRQALYVMSALNLLAIGLVGWNVVSTDRGPDAAVPKEPYNVLILSSDGIEARNMSVYGYARKTTPFLDSKAGEFLLFENAFTNNGNTTGSITSLLTGRSPGSTGVVYPPDQLSGDDARYSLPYLLGRAGYYRSNWAVPHYADAHDQNMLEAFDWDNEGNVLASASTPLPLGAGVGRWFITESLEDLRRLTLDVLGIRELDNSFVQVAAVNGDTLGDDRRLQSVLKEIRTKDRFFINTHFMVTHGPGFQIPHPRFSRGKTQATGYELDFYDDSILEFDRYVRTIFESLVSLGKLEETIVIVTSDHGINKSPIERIPLMIRFPNTALTGRSQVNVQRLDVAPTVTEALGMATPDWFEGTSLISWERIPADRTLIALNAAEPRPFGARAFDLTDKIILTQVRCQSYLRVFPEGVTRGRVNGSTASCNAAPKQ